jgi:hypothetical protein
MDFPPQLVSETGVHNGNGQFQSTAVGPGEIGSAISSISYAFTTPEFKEIVAPAVTTMPAIRCDNALPGSGPGCVFPQYIPPLQTGIENPEYSQHLGDALRSGLPGAYPDGTPLHRTTSALIRDLNGAKACPDRYPRPSGKSCDEYPFRSTYEGAAVAIPPGVARTFDWCEIDEPPGTGPVGYSVCMIDELQNSSGGGFLNSFYLSNRVLDHDPFRVWVQSGVLDAFIPPQGVTDRPPTADAGPDVSGDEGSPIALHGAAADAESTPTTHWTYVAHTDVDHGATCSFGDAGALSTTITCTDDGTFDVRLTATDDAGNSVTDTAVVHVPNVRPTLALTGPAAWQLYRAGTPVTVTAPVTDPGTNDTHTCVATWDDGSTSSYAASGHACNQSHTFAHAGMYTITLSATDDDGGVSDTVSVMVVVYDPDAGWTNMDGSTATPSGALAAYPNANQWTWAHLDAHYCTATGPPVGVAQTWVPGTPYGMNSVALQWLVVTPDGKIAARGTGTGNDGSALGFVFYGYRGCPATGPDCQAGADRMRLVVWSLAAGPNPGAGTVYDNRPAAGYDIDVTEPQPLTSGAVQIHH